jgi:hypothetical protein
LSFQQAVGYDYFYRQAQQLAQTDVQTFVFSARTPRAALLNEYGYSVTAQSGVYRSANVLLHSIPLVLLNELRWEPHNAFVQCFASQRRVREAAFQRMAQTDWRMLDEGFWDFLAGLRTYIGRKGNEMSELAMKSVLTPEVVMETGKQLRQALLAVLTPEERLAGLAPEERLAGLAPEERLAGLTPEELIALMARIEAYLHQQQTDAQQPADENVEGV